MNKQVQVNVESKQKVGTTVALTEMELNKRLRQKRSSAYIDAVTKLDAGGVTCSKAKIEELKQAIHKEFPDVPPFQYPIGIISKCYLGDPYEVHTLDITLDIVEHFKVGQALPAQMDRGRGIALHPSYEFIEIYNDMLRAVNRNGDVAVIQG